MASISAVKQWGIIGLPTQTQVHAVQQFVHSIKMQKILPISYEPEFIHWVQLCRSDIDKCFHHGQTLSKLNQNAMTNLVRAMDPDALAPIASKRVSVLCMIHEHSRRSKATHATLQTKSLPTLKLLLLYSHTELKYFSYFIYFSVFQNTLLQFDLVLF